MVIKVTSNVQSYKSYGMKVQSYGRVAYLEQFYFMVKYCLGVRIFELFFLSQIGLWGTGNQSGNKLLIHMYDLN